MKANVKLIEWLLFESEISAVDINRGTGLAPMTISDLRNKKSDIMRMRLDNAIKLTDFSKQEKELEEMKNTRYIIKMNGKHSILTDHEVELLKNPQRVTGQHHNDKTESIKREFEIIKKVLLTPEIKEFEVVKEKINRLATSSRQEVWYDDYNELKELALKSVGF